jgi:hypothetical protein
LLRKCGPDRQKGSNWKWRTLRGEDLQVHNWYSLLSIRHNDYFKEDEADELRWMLNAYTAETGKPDSRVHLESLGANGRMRAKWV